MFSDAASCVFLVSSYRYSSIWHQRSHFEYFCRPLAADMRQHGARGLDHSRALRDTCRLLGVSQGSIGAVLALSSDVVYNYGFRGIIFTVRLVFFGVLLVHFKMRFHGTYRVSSFCVRFSLCCPGCLPAFSFSVVFSKSGSGASVHF